MSEPIYTLKKEWDDTLAEEIFILEVEEDNHYVGDYSGVSREKRDVASGDRAWALRQAKHYGIRYNGLE